MLTQDQLEVALKAFLDALPKGVKVQAMSVVPRVGQEDVEARPVMALVLADSEEDFKRLGQVIDRGISSYRSELGLTASYERNILFGN